MRVVSNILIFFLVLIALYWLWSSEDAHKLLRALKEGGEGTGASIVDGFGRALCKGWGC